MKKLYKINKLNFLLLLLSVMIYSSCKTDKIAPISEPLKDLTGTWKIIKATRNGTDLFTLVDTSVINFNKFTVQFKDNNYLLNNPLPFIVSVNGTYKLDDPQYPLRINFTQPGTTTPSSTVFSYPIVNGVRTLVMVFSPGCPQNSYTYSFVKVQ